MTDLTELKAEVAGLRDELAQHTAVDLAAHSEAAESRTEVLAMVTETRDSVKGLVDAWDALQGLVKVGRWVGTFIKWAGGIALTIGAVWALLKTGRFDG